MLTDPTGPNPPDAPAPPADVAAFAGLAGLTFLRPPRGVTAVLADVVRVIGLLTFLFSVFAWTGTTSAMFALALLGLVAPRGLGARPGLDLGIGITTLVSAASNRLDLYETLPWWDIPAHLVTTAALAALVILLADRAGVVVDRRSLPLGFLALTVGLALSALWELGEWAGQAWLDPEILTGYSDTIGDMAVGGLGALLMAPLMPMLLARSRWITEVAAR
ncbi:hypothetical protein [Clavibacter michiganensis]|nr:hypothetical protein [Clavibacter michiganensis]AWF97302.1 hypothetical protein BEH61_02155 [Clavibacter michiganensis subsp. insidiosus]AWG02610.1 hypothetical protein BEH62_13505 [Clavibacter michiganensis subsp. insidiosus]OQJ58957.1 hypothetical protein B5P21_02875 [Clavibacter michiganensis subsp. insidiosus]RII86474.1 hypothetical protein DZF92_10480 [Clavibacter michiganensis subsp. insidiosus]RMC85282.1 hypothetical protein CmiCFBP2404_08500 [Clavibacter michiganensis subsp. insidio